MHLSQTMHPVLRVLLFLFVSSATLGAQTSATGGTVSGIVHDEVGNVVPNARVSVRDSGTNQVRRAVSDEEGVFRLAAMPAGTYEMSVAATGFGEFQIREIKVVLGQSTAVDVALLPAGVQAAVVVSGSAEVMDVSQTAVTTSITTENVEELPVRERNYLQFALLAPGVAASPGRSPSGGSGGSGTSLADSGFTFGGLRARSNSITIDGLSNIDETTGAPLVALSPEIVREFQVVNNGISAEFGSAAGGTINVITKTGSNEFHGTAFTFYQNQQLNARNPTDAQRRLYHAYQPGFSLGGPLRNDKLFFYVSAEQEHQIADEEQEIARNVRTQINAALALGFAPGLPVRSLQDGTFRTGRDQTEAAGKLTWVVDPYNTAHVRYAFTNDRERGDAFNTSIINDPTSRGSIYSKDHQLTASLASVIHQSVINEARTAVSRRTFESRAGVASGPEIDIVGKARFGLPYSASGTRRESRIEAVDALTLPRGKHEWKLGGGAEHVSLDAQLQDGFGGVYIFRSVSDFLAARPAMWRQAFGDARTRLTVTHVGGFVQDRWQPLRTVTLDLGVRYDVRSLPAKFAADHNNVSPRIGFAWSPAKDWVVRGAYGILYDRLPLAYLNMAPQKDGTKAFDQMAYDERAAQIFAANGGGPAVAPVAGISPSILRPAGDFRTPYSSQAFVGAERLLDKGLTVRGDLLFTRGVNLPRLRNANLTPPVVLTSANAPALGFTNPTPQQIGRPVFGPARLDPRYDGIYELENAARSRYRGLSLSANKRFRKEGSAQFSYTFSKTEDDASDFFEQPENPFSVPSEWAPSLLDVRHRFVVSGVFELPFDDENDRAAGSTKKEGPIAEIFGDIEVAPIITLSSGRPVNPLTGTDDEHSGAWPLASRPLRVLRNSLVSPTFFNADLRVVKYITLEHSAKLDLAFEFFNLLNHPNVIAVDPNFGPGLSPLSTYTRPVEFAPARQFRFSLDLEW